jgi:hypothetical protein
MGIQVKLQEVKNILHTKVRDKIAFIDHYCKQAWTVWYEYEYSLYAHCLIYSLPYLLIALKGPRLL